MADEIKAGGVKVQAPPYRRCGRCQHEAWLLAMQGSVSVVALDLADLSSVHTLSHSLIQQKQRLDIVICNAGVACFQCPVIARG